MNIYLLTQTYATGYDTYDSVIVAAPDETIAQRIHPSTGVIWNSEIKGWVSLIHGNPMISDDWAIYPEQVTVKLIGIALEGTPSGVILSSFNAG